MPNQFEDNLLKTFEGSGIEVEDDAAMQRKEELVRVSEYQTLSKESTEALRDRAVREALIPKNYRDAVFDSDKIKENIKRQNKESGHSFKVVRYDEYVKVCTSILNTIKSKRVPDRSYLIGAPGGFGKQSFATECILASLNNGWMTVPYMSLNEIGQLSLENDKIIARGLMGAETKLSQQYFSMITGEYVDKPSGDTIVGEEYSYYVIGDNSVDIKTPRTVLGQYSWSEYINAPVLVCFFSGRNHKLSESYTLSSLLAIRSAKGYPTIAMISESMDNYLKDTSTGRYIWREIYYKYDPKNEDDCYRGNYGMIGHISTFKSFITERIRQS
jgi:hypothetical protein